MMLSSATLTAFCGRIKNRNIIRKQHGNNFGGLSNNIFASRYVSYIPNKEQLIAQVEAVLNEWHNSEKE